MHCTIDLELTPEIIQQNNSILTALLSKANVVKHPSSLAELRLKQSGVESNSSMAALAAKADGLSVSNASGTWVMASPVHLVLQRDAFTLYPEVPIPLSLNEAEAIQSRLNEHFKEYQMRFFIGASGQWYANVQDHTMFSDFVGLSHPSHAAGQSVDAFMPTQGGARQWLQVYNEIQMLLFDCQENLTRTQNNQLPINSIWFYGAGESEQIYEESIDQHYLSNAPFYHGIALETQARWGELPTDANGLQQVVADSNAPAMTLDLTNVQAFERWLDISQKLLKLKRFKRLTIQLGWRECTLVALIRPIDIWRFWRKPNSIKHYLQ